MFGNFQRLPQRTLMGLVRAYRLLFKAWLGSACRFEPSCSAYALQALQQHGAAKGCLLTSARLMRCHPYCAGGCDPVPHTFLNPASGLFSRLCALPARPAQPANTQGELPHPLIRN